MHVAAIRTYRQQQRTKQQRNKKKSKSKWFLPSSFLFSFILLRHRHTHTMDHWPLAISRITTLRRFGSCWLGEAILVHRSLRAPVVAKFLFTRHCVAASTTSRLTVAPKTRANVPTKCKLTELNHEAIAICQHCRIIGLWLSVGCHWQAGRRRRRSPLAPDRDQFGCSDSRPWLNVHHAGPANQTKTWHANAVAHEHIIPTESRHFDATSAGCCLEIIKQWR